MDATPEDKTGKSGRPARTVCACTLLNAHRTCLLPARQGGRPDGEPRVVIGRWLPQGTGIGSAHQDRSASDIKSRDPANHNSADGPQPDSAPGKAQRSGACAVGHRDRRKPAGCGAYAHPTRSRCPRPSPRPVCPASTRWACWSQPRGERGGSTIFSAPGAPAHRDLLHQALQPPAQTAGRCRPAASAASATPGAGRDRSPRRRPHRPGTAHGA